MTFGDALLVLAALSALICIAISAARLRRDSNPLERISRFTAYASFILLTLVLLFLASLFLTSNFSYDYVWSHSSSGTDPFYKLIGVWAGGEGGLVLWAWFMGLAMSLEIFFQKRRGFSERFQAIFRASSASMVLLFSLILIAAGLFAPTPASDLSSQPNGLGMNLSLQTIEMAVHPPVVFAGYAFCLVIFSVSLAYLLTRETNWMNSAIPWSRASLFLLSAGILVGGIWAYYELGWGGFWVWDPVETSSLIPWLVLISFLHLKNSARSGALLPFLGMLAFISVLLSAFITRTGGLWGSSVHTYGSAVSGSIENRFVTILMADKSIMGLFFVIILLFAIALILSYRGRRWMEKAEEGWDLATVILLLLSIVLLMGLMIKNTGLNQGQNFVELTERMSYLAVALLALLSARLVWTQLDRRKALISIGLIVLLSIVLAIFGQATSSFPWLVGLVLPSSIAAIAVSAQRILRLGVPKGKAWVRRVCPQLVHIGIAIVLVGFIVSSTMQTSLPPEKETMAVGDLVAVGGYSVQLIGIEEKASNDSGSSAATIRTASFLVSIPDEGIRTVEITNSYSNETGTNQLQHGGTYINNGIGEDFYMNFDWMGNSTALVHARVVPMVTEVWFGASLVLLGTLGLALIGRVPKRSDAS